MNKLPKLKEKQLLNTRAGFYSNSPYLPKVKNNFPVPKQNVQNPEIDVKDDGQCRKLKKKSICDEFAFSPDKLAAERASSNKIKKLGLTNYDVWSSTYSKSYKEQRAARSRQFA